MIIPPLRGKPIGIKWIYKVKINSHGDIVRYKARLEAKDYIQKYCIDYKIFFAPMARMKTIQVLLAITSQER